MKISDDCVIQGYCTDDCERLTMISNKLKNDLFKVLFSTDIVFF